MRCLSGGRIEAIRFKVNLPNYGVFDEKRVFASGPLPGPVSFRGVRLGLPVCEDTWTDWGDYENVVECLAETGAEILVVPNGSPYWRDKADIRLNVAVARVTETGLPLIYVNQVGGQDELVFDGASFALNADRSIAFQLPAFRETVVTTHWSRIDGVWRCAKGPIAPAEEADKADYTACVLGLRDYVDKNRFKGVVLGLSGGINSALCAAMAVDALGAERVRCVMLPYRYTSQESLDDAAAIAARARRALRHRADRERGAWPRGGAGRRFRRRAARRHRGESAGARPRHHPDGDLQQIRPDGGDDRQQVGNVGRLCHALWRHERRLQSDQGSLQDRSLSAVAAAQPLEAARARAARLARSFRKTSSRARRAPSCARTRPTRTRCRPTICSIRFSSGWSSARKATAAIVAAGFDRDTVMKVERMLNLAEYKRRQAAPGVKVTLKNFGRDRRYPIVNRFNDPGTAIRSPTARRSKARRWPKRAVRIFDRRSKGAGQAGEPKRQSGTTNCASAFATPT